MEEILIGIGLIIIFIFCIYLAKVGAGILIIPAVIVGVFAMALIGVMVAFMPRQILFGVMFLVLACLFYGVYWLDKKLEAMLIVTQENRFLSKVVAWSYMVIVTLLGLLDVVISTIGWGGRLFSSAYNGLLSPIVGSGDYISGSFAILIWLMIMAVGFFAISRTKNKKSIYVTTGALAALILVLTIVPPMLRNTWHDSIRRQAAEMLADGNYEGAMEKMTSIGEDIADKAQLDHAVLLLNEGEVESALAIIRRVAESSERKDEIFGVIFQIGAEQYAKGDLESALEVFTAITGRGYGGTRTSDGMINGEKISAFAMRLQLEYAIRESNKYLLE